ncbi:uncharacterized protein LOC132328171 [Haemorhous mexicanus]|uniref:uncharacterized protein LOC132328171 n=1 Tax=Haemorhous mexicanus TaxID=30427 RepID=UPI0028BDD7F0|nr:uncharacterized protein LOC132328171 [Haemorhous mexicanus]
MKQKLKKRKKREREEKRREEKRREEKRREEKRREEKRREEKRREEKRREGNMKNLTVPSHSEQRLPASNKEGVRKKSTCRKESFLDKWQNQLWLYGGHLIQRGTRIEEGSIPHLTKWGGTSCTTPCSLLSQANIICEILPYVTGQR